MGKNKFPMNYTFQNSCCCNEYHIHQMQKPLFEAQ